MTLFFVLAFIGSPLFAADSEAPASELSKSSALVTVAVVLMGQQADGSSWDMSGEADIVLCGEKGCYVSNGLTKDATYYKNSHGPILWNKAGSCRDTLKCVFRGVDPKVLSDKVGIWVQPVDVDYWSHTPLEKQYVTKGNGSAPSCSASGGSIICYRGIHRRGYSLWLMDEQVAVKGGKGGLDNVLFKGLLSQRVDALASELMVVRQKLMEKVPQFYGLLFKTQFPQSCTGTAAFLTESFYVTGLADASQRRAEFVLKKLVGGGDLLEMKSLIRRTPEIYWAFLDIAGQLLKFSSAQRAVYEEKAEALFLRDQGGVTELVYGWQAQARARSVAGTCGIEIVSQSPVQSKDKPVAKEQ